MIENFTYTKIFEFLTQETFVVRLLGLYEKNVIIITA